MTDIVPADDASINFETSWLFVQVAYLGSRMKKSCTDSTKSMFGATSGKNFQRHCKALFFPRGCALSAEKNTHNHQFTLICHVVQSGLVFLQKSVPLKYQKTDGQQLISCHTLKKLTSSWQLLLASEYIYLGQNAFASYYHEQIYLISIYYYLRSRSLQTGRYLLELGIISILLGEQERKFFF